MFQDQDVYTFFSYMFKKFWTEVEVLLKQGEVKEGEEEEG